MNLVKIGGAVVVLAAIAAAIVLGTRGGDPVQPQSTASNSDASTAEVLKSAASKAALTAAVDAFGAAMRDRDYDTVISTIPPAVMSSLAEKLGMADDSLGPAMRNQMEVALDAVELVDFKMDTASAELKKVDGGMIYAVLETRTVMKTGGKTIEAKTPTLALFVDGKWHLMRIESDTQRAIIVEVYPDLKDVTLPKATMKIVEG